MSEIRVLSEEDVEELLDLDTLLGVVGEAFVEQHRGNVKRPDRPHFPVGTGLASDIPEEPLGTGLVMPAYVHGASCSGSLHHSMKSVAAIRSASLSLPDANMCPWAFCNRRFFGSKFPEGLSGRGARVTT